jgi:hypothetical protein
LKPLQDNLRECEKEHRDGEAKNLAQLVETNKKSLAQRLEKLGSVLEITAEEGRETALGFIDTLVLEGDSRPENRQLVSVFCKTMATTLSLPSNSIRRLWLCRIVETGSVNYFRSFMNVRGMEKYLAQPKYDSSVADILKYVSHCKYLRIDMVIELLHHAESLSLDDRVEKLAGQWAKIFLGTIPACENRSVAEVRTHRNDLVMQIMKMPHSVRWCMHQEVDGMEHSVFSKCCAEGDDDFIRFAFASGFVTREQANTVLSTGLTPLMHAVARKREAVVKVLTQYAPRLVDVDLRTSIGTAVEMANLNGAQEIARLLKSFSAQRKK